MSRLVVLGLMLAGCDQVFGLDGRIEGDAREPDGLCSVTNFANQRYRLEMTPSSWLAAEASCEALDEPGDEWFSHLAVITDRTEISALGLPLASEMWTGLLSPDRGPFVWVTDEVTDAFPFGPGKPSSGSEDRCGAARESTLYLDDTSCSGLKPFVCECDHFPALPDRYVGL